MNARDIQPIADVQNSPDTRNLAINKVGIKAIRHPVRLADRDGGVQHSIATFNMYVHLPQHFKGTHMSRFVEILNSRDREISVENFEPMLREMVKRLEAESGYIEMSFPYFINKAAPISGVQSLMDYEVTFIGELRDGQYRFTMKVLVPVTSLCPCSKKISEYGAHNQRSHVTITARTREIIWIEDIVRLVEDEASCELYGLLKRPDEKYVTERAYDNPKFVEDMVRDVAARLNAEERIEAYVVESKKFKTIQNLTPWGLIHHHMTFSLKMGLSLKRGRISGRFSFPSIHAIYCRGRHYPGQQRRVIREKVPRLPLSHFSMYRGQSARINPVQTQYRPTHRKALGRFTEHRFKCFLHAHFMHQQRLRFVTPIIEIPCNNQGCMRRHLVADFVPQQPQLLATISRQQIQMNTHRMQRRLPTRHRQFRVQYPAPLQPIH